ncbi:MAG: hypothetical protein HYU36_14005 [Planctomycetes bacterium]|nr:hypothetical protein [Planctomycetota bacterium]
MCTSLRAVFVACGLALTALPVQAQVTIEGELAFHSVYRDNVYDFLDRRVIVGGEAGRDDAHFYDSQLNLNFTASLTGNVSVVAGLQSNFLWGMDDRAGSFNPTNRSAPDVRLAYVELKEFIWPQLTARLGLQSLAYDLRGDGNEFFLNTDERENRRWLQSDTAFDNQSATTTNVSSAGFGLAPTDAGGTTPVIGDVNSSAAGAVKFTWDADPVFLDLFAAKLEESAGSLNPNFTRDDHDAYGLVIDLLMGENSLMRAHIIYFHNEAFAASNGNISIYEFGVGLSYLFDVGNPLEVFGEFGYQLGDFGTNADAAGNRFDVDQDAYAFLVGIKYTFENLTYAPWFEFSYTHFTADDDSTDADQEAWVPYGDIDDTLIFEENHYGLGVNSGYTAAKAKTGFKPSEETAISFIFGYFWATEEKFQRLQAGALRQLDYDTLVGWEMDLAATWDYTEDLTFRIAVGFFAAEDFLDDAVDGGGAGSTIDADNALLFDIGLNARF